MNAHQRRKQRRKNPEKTASWWDKLLKGTPIGTIALLSSPTGRDKSNTMPYFLFSNIRPSGNPLTMKILKERAGELGSYEFDYSALDRRITEQLCAE